MHLGTLMNKVLYQDKYFKSKFFFSPEKRLLREWWINWSYFYLILMFQLYPLRKKGDRNYCVTEKEALVPRFSWKWFSKNLWSNGLFLPIPKFGKLPHCVKGVNKNNEWWKVFSYKVSPYMGQLRLVFLRLLTQKALHLPV